MNVSGQLQPRPDNRQYVPMRGRYPLEAGFYYVSIQFLGVYRVKFIDGAFYWSNGDQIPDGIILGWK